MKYLSIALLTYVAILFTPFVSSAQASLGLFTTSVSDNTPALNDQLSVFTKLINVSTTDTFIGIVNFELANKDSIITNVLIVGKPALSGTTITLAPQQELPLLFTVQLNPSYFSVGPDIIIVWPIASVPITDSARGPIQIISTVGIQENLSTPFLFEVINNELLIENKDSKSALKQVRLFDLLGKVITTYSINSQRITISISNLPKGVYIAEILIEGAKTKRLKFVK